MVVRWQQKGGHAQRSMEPDLFFGRRPADQETAEAMERGVEADYRSHMNFWKGYWTQSSVSLPDTLLQKQYDNEMYKFGAAAAKTLIRSPFRQSGQPITGCCRPGKETTIMT